MLNYIVDESGIAHMSGDYTMDYSDVSTIVTAAINLTNTQGRECIINALIRSQGIYYFTGMLYSHKLYGSGIITKYNNTCYQWSIDNGNVTVNQL